MWFEEIKEILIKESEEFRQVAQEHKKYDLELKDLAGRRYLTPDEQLHEVELKKMKLSLKDKMLAMASEYRRKNQA
jgi:uncharacterized protein YdcH (DUF465 family)